MICIFALFVFGSARMFRLFEIGLVSAVFLGACVIRGLLLSAVLRLFGRITWTLPRWLDRRLPRVSIEPEPTASRRAPDLALEAGS
jgi:putative drug exporter of the RND superfamily